MKQFIYADNAATTKLDIDAFEAMKPYLLDEYGNASQQYSFARKPKQALKEARLMIAQCINADAEEIYFTSGGTESDNWAIRGVTDTNINKKTIVTSSFEHHAILRACESIERHGYPVTYIKPSRSGIIEPGSLEKIITHQTQLVSIMMANNEIGTIQPIRELAQIAHKNGAFFHTDAVQCIGHVPVDVKELEVDMLSASAHKFNGPKGIGFLYIKKGIDMTSFMAGGGQENMRRAGTENIASIVAMAVALKNNTNELQKNMEYLKHLEQCLISKLNDSGVEYIRNGCGEMLPGLISLSFLGKDGEALLHRLDLQGICVSTGSACDSVTTQVSHVLRAISLEDAYAKGTIRVSFGKSNTEKEANIIGEKIINSIRN